MIRATSTPMRISIACPFIMILAVLVAQASVISAARMAPDRQEAAWEAYVLAHATTGDDLCGAGHKGPHHCPFCHSLPEAPHCAHDAPVQRLVPAIGWRQRADLHRRAQGRNINHSPRAPPLTA
ncbi:hypothetical protein FGG78_04235 [Thioclava sp. BHET1]|nr:hypothetical protein FGG78_04235 [Thioclava sp. BHET1]